MERSIKVIIVDDSPMAIEGVKVLLEPYKNFNVIDVFCNGKEVIDSDNLVNADLIIMDIEMPVLGGIETAKHINYMYPNIKLLALTMYQHKLYLKDIIGSGFNGFVNKGSMTEDLINVIFEVLSNKRSYPKDIKI
ncbi:response regulator [Plebeiibacterium marinum]|uniref:Response regulator transcription factor n=1 Tax=Plebeiibacterium marinum TaxID=2992111 RepID=A0AAE3MI47_9BACT|nr:response regulator transcription factor [Plebeiobacterium marinum]MCW3807944.1 response regulator transcription factor [Plebeiobacterium marinum]